MAIESADEFWERFEQSGYDTAHPLERIFINYFRWRDGKPALRATPPKRRLFAR